MHPILRSIFAAILWAICLSEAQSQAVVSNVRAAQRVGTKLVDVYYDLSTTVTVTVDVAISSDGGQTYTVPTASAVGDLGAGLSAGTAKHIVWNAESDWNNQLSNAIKFRITATGPPPELEGFSRISAGNFTMGDVINEGHSYERPPHFIYLNQFYIAKNEVTMELWNAVQAWGLNNGYSDIPSRGGKAGSHPVQSINWYAAIKWCNARSQKEGLAPCYKVGASIYKTGQSDFVSCDWNANGYRLPTEAEWEKAARGALDGNRFPWGNSISHSLANYLANNGTEFGNQSGDAGLHPAFAVGNSPYTSPVGSFADNGYGLKDMAGNVHEWCWDWSSTNYYATSPASNPKGPTSGSERVYRGGSFMSSASDLRVSDRHYTFPSFYYEYVGFRVVRSSGL